MEKPETIEKKLSIAIVCDAVTDCIAGSFISTQRFAKLLRDRGHTVVFVSGRSPKNPATNYFQEMKVHRFVSVLVPKSEGQMYLSFPTKKQLEKLFKEEKIDVVHIMIPMPSSITAVKVARKLGIPIVAHSHTQPENIFLHLPKFLPIKTLNKIFNNYLHWLYRQTDAIVYPSEFSRKMFPVLSNEMKTLVVSNGINTNIFKKVNADSFFEKFNLSREKKNILYVGRLHPEKNVHTLIQAVPHIIKSDSKVHFFIVGFGHLSKQLEQLVRELRVEKHITFFGKVSDEDLLLAYNAADLFVLPSAAELEGMAVLEAMACGKPILVANSKDSASTYFVDGNGFLFNLEDPKDLAEKALWILSDETLRRKMQQASLEKSRQYNIEESVTTLEKLYYSLVNAR